MNWGKIRGYIKRESFMFSFGYLKFLLGLSGLISIIFVLYASIDLAKMIKAEGMTEKAQNYILLITVCAIVSILCFYFLRSVQKKGNK